VKSAPSHGVAAGRRCAFLAFLAVPAPAPRCLHSSLCPLLACAPLCCVHFLRVPLFAVCTSCVCPSLLSALLACASRFWCTLLTVHACCFVHFCAFFVRPHVCGVWTVRAAHVCAACHHCRVFLATLPPWSIWPLSTVCGAVQGLLGAAIIANGAAMAVDLRAVRGLCGPGTAGCLACSLCAAGAARVGVLLGLQDLGSRILACIQMSTCPVSGAAQLVCSACVSICNRRTRAHAKAHEQAPLAVPPK